MLTTITKAFIICAALFLCLGGVNAQDAIAPPSLGEETKGTPATIETNAEQEQTLSASESRSTQNADNSQASIFDSPTVTESRRDNGQVYRIELEHSVGGKQIIEETGSDTLLETTPNDIEDTPNLPKWQIGSW